MNTIDQLIGEAHRYGVDLLIINGRLKAVPPGRLPAHLIAELRSAAAEVKARLMAESGSYMELLDLETLIDAIASSPRSPFLNDLALARGARVAVEAGRLVRRLPDGARREALALCAAASRKIAIAIRQGNYRTAYELLDGLPDQLRSVQPQ